VNLSAEEWAELAASEGIESPDVAALAAAGDRFSYKVPKVAHSIEYGGEVGDGVRCSCGFKVSGTQLMGAHPGRVGHAHAANTALDLGALLEHVNRVAS
jgi:hypothetical protein